MWTYDCNSQLSEFLFPSPTLFYHFCAWQCGDELILFKTKSGDTITFMLQDAWLDNVEVDTKYNEKAQKKKTKTRSSDDIGEDKKENSKTHLKSEVVFSCNMLPVHKLLAIFMLKCMSS